MKLSVLLTSLELLRIVTCVRGGLRSVALGGTLEVNDPLEVVYDDESNRRHEHERKTLYHEEKLAEDQSPFDAYDPLVVLYEDEHHIEETLPEGQSSSHASAHGRRLGGDPLSTGITSAALRMSCLNYQRAVLITIKTDDEGHETSWDLTKKGESSPRYYGPEGDVNYRSSTAYSGAVCVGIGMYEFTIRDVFSDGLCCGAGYGYYDVDVQNEDGSWRSAVRGSKFAGMMSHVIDVGRTESTMTGRDKAYLVAHNKRRLEWHSRYNKAYVPLKWSKGLKDSSLVYAEKLLETCLTAPPDHESNNLYGENLARNKGSPNSFGQLYSPDEIVGRFIEREEGLPWARNGHLTNALWRATNYVGCAEAEKSYLVNGNTHWCRAQVCRYAKPGNCSMGKYRLANGDIDWETPMLMDDSPCGPECPPEGCFH